jgi:hypothetical protein
MYVCASCVLRVLCTCTCAGWKIFYASRPNEHTRWAHFELIFVKRDLFSTFELSPTRLSGVHVFRSVHSLSHLNHQHATTSNNIVVLIVEEAHLRVRFSTDMFMRRGYLNRDGGPDHADTSDNHLSISLILLCRSVLCGAFVLSPESAGSVFRLVPTHLSEKVDALVVTNQLR